MERDIKFDWVINLSGSTYPLASNDRVLKTLGRADVNTNFMDIKERQSSSSSKVFPFRKSSSPCQWHYFVECGGKLFRIGRMPFVTTITMHVGSQVC